MFKQTILAIAISSSFLSAPVFAAPPIGSTDNDQFYYQIGGATSITASPGTGTTGAMSASLELGLGYSCGKFDPIAGLKNSVKKVAAITDTLAAAVSAAISSLPLLILQRVNPGLYDLLQNLIIKGEATLALANTSCEQMEAEIKKGNNPYEAWTDLSKMVDWKVEMQAGKEDVVGAKAKVEKQNGKNGIPWIGGTRAGGDNGQKQINITKDVVSAGWDMNGGGRLREVFKTPGEASDWAVAVLGDVNISTYDNHVDQSQPGTGLLPRIEGTMLTVSKNLQDLVSGVNKPTLPNLREASSNDLLLTQPVIKALQDLPPTEQAIVTGKLASEVAMSRNLEKAIFVRRMLLSGRFEPNVVKTAALNHVDNAVKELDRTIDDVLFEKRVHQELVSNTALMLLENAKQHQNRGKVQQREAGYDLKPMEDGAVK
jgi:integrating conjugative element protein (TIGR03755 family)